MSIDIAVPRDADAIAEIVNAAYRGHRDAIGWTNEIGLLKGARTDAAAVAALIADGTTVLLARADDGAALGCIAIDSGDESWMLSMLAVDPARQSAGTGKQLLDAAERGARMATMTVIRQRDTLIAWYQRRGYRATGQIEPFPYGDDSVGTPLRDDLAFVVLAKTL